TAANSPGAVPVLVSWKGTPEPEEETATWSVGRRLLLPETRFWAQLPGDPATMQSHCTPFMSTKTSPTECVPLVGAPAVAAGTRSRGASPPWVETPMPEVLTAFAAVPRPWLMAERPMELASGGTA